MIHQRSCAGCGCALSRYNAGDFCGGCSRPAACTGGLASGVAGAEIGSRLRAVRLRRGMTLRVLAGLSGVTPAYLSMIENGKRRLDRYSRIAMLADALGVIPADLIHGTDLPSAHPGPARTALR